MVERAILLLRFRQGELKQNLHSACSTGGGGGYTTDWMTMHEAQEANLGNGDKPDYFQCRALVHSVKSANAIYKACPQACNKKLIDQDNRQFYSVVKSLTQIIPTSNTVCWST
jgi:hypothetical protein